LPSFVIGWLQAITGAMVKTMAKIRAFIVLLIVVEACGCQCKNKRNLWFQ
jgi:hypothetical protein